MGIIKQLHIPKGLVLQWHITEKCNLRCKHCYHTKYNSNELPIKDLLEILDQYKNLLKIWRRHKNIFAHINITGGEPFLRKDFFKFLEIISANRDFFSFAILTNGTMIDSAIAKKLKKLKPKFIQVSIEGNRETHDKIRGKGNFDKAVGGLKELIKLKIPTCISFTAHKGNYKEFSEVVKLAKSIGVTRVWADRMLPSGSGKKMKILGPKETCDFIHQMQESKKKAAGFFSKTEVVMHRALQFKVAKGRPYKCSAGDSLITVQANGDLYPCRRMPIKVGNLLEKDLSEIYYKDKLFQKLRDEDRVSKGCEKCFYAKLCNGGLKCLSYAVHNDPFKKDPGCWIKHD